MGKEKDENQTNEQSNPALAGNIPVHFLIRG
jgi:hypothetical protein